MTKLERQWLKTRKLWIKENPPNHEGYYICAIGGDWVPANAMKLDHIIPRSNRPDLRFVLNNLQPTCERHNNQKGSKH